jgi:hypothetical protein
MDTRGETGAPEQESGSEHSDHRIGDIHVESLPVRIEIVGIAPQQYFLNVHTARVRTTTTTIHIEIRGFDQIPASYLLTVGEEIIRVARSRIREGTVQITSL